MYHCHKPIDSINLLGSWRRRSVFPVKYGETYRVELSFEEKTGQWIMYRVVIVILIRHHHKPIDFIFDLSYEIAWVCTQYSNSGHYLQAPQPADSWEGIRDALTEGPVAPQVDDIVEEAYLGEEDCLYLNVYTPKVRVTLNSTYIYACNLVVLYWVMHQKSVFITCWNYVNVSNMD
jgi:hypothetical protein